MTTKQIAHNNSGSFYAATLQTETKKILKRDIDEEQRISVFVFGADYSVYRNIEKYFFCELVN